MATIWYVPFAIAKQAQQAFCCPYGLETSQLFNNTCCALALHMKVNPTL